MLASLLARYSAQGHPEMDRYAQWVAALHRLRDDWEGGARPAVRQLRDYLQGIPEWQRADALQDIIAEHLRRSWSAGHGPRLEAYFVEFGKDFAELASQAVAPAELIDDEFLARYQVPYGDTPSLREYQERFPKRADVMERLGRRFVGNGRFVKLHKRGLGAFGEVWEAHDHGFPRSSTVGDERRIAIKEPRGSPREEADALRRFAEETRVTDSLDHPGIVALREHRLLAGAMPIYVMRLVNGRTFAERIRDFHQPPVGRTPNEQRLVWNQLLQSLVMICEATEHAHAHGVLHRDLKPGNVVVDEAGNALILDWGMATRASFIPTVPSHDIIAGTPDYMAPEQADGRTDTRSDIFSLGAILYEVLTGRSPHGWSDGARPADWLRIVREAQFQHPRRLRPQAPRPLEAICMKAVAREPGQRYQTAADLVTDLRCYIAGEPVSASAESVWGAAWRWCRNFPRKKFSSQCLG